MPLQREHELFRQSLRRFLEERLSPYLDEWETTGLPYRDVFPALGARGYLGIGQPIEYGGLGLDHQYTTVWAQELGRLSSGSPAMCLSVQSDIVLPLLLGGSPEVRERYLRPAIAGSKVVAFAVTEEAGGSDPANIRTVATSTPDGFVIDGRKCWITNGSVADVAVVACRTSDTGTLADLSLLAVPTDTTGVTRHRVPGKLGNRGSDHGFLTFDQVKVSRDHLLGGAGDGFALMTETFVRERRFLAVVACAQARRILTETLRWVKTHRVSGGLLFDQQSVRMALVDLTTELELIEAYIDRWSTSAADETVTLRQVSVMKLRATQLLRQIADAALQWRGARAYMSDNGSARDFRDARASSLAGGSEEVLQHLIGRHLDLQD